MTRITTTNQKKKMTMPGIAYPPMLRLATNASYPAPNDLFRYFLGADDGGAVPGSARAGAPVTPEHTPVVPLTAVRPAELAPAWQPRDTLIR